MAVPEFQTFLLPLLAATRDGKQHRLRDLVPVLADTLRLTEEDVRRRTIITSALVDGRAMQNLDEPQLVCERLIAALSPSVREIAKRSGASRGSPS